MSFVCKARPTLCVHGWAVDFYDMSSLYTWYLGLPRADYFVHFVVSWPTLCVHGWAVVRGETISHILMHICICACICACMHVQTSMHVYICTYAYPQALFRIALACVFNRIKVYCVYVYVYVCMYV